MEYVEEKRILDVISWVLGGRGFIVHDPDRLVEILPLFFSQTKYRSFRRQLNMWHFERIEKGPCKGAFVHPYFVRGEKDLASSMSRQIMLKPRRTNSFSSAASTTSTETTQKNVSSNEGKAGGCWEQHQDHHQQQLGHLLALGAAPDITAPSCVFDLGNDDVRLKHYSIFNKEDATTDTPAPARLVPLTTTKGGGSFYKEETPVANFLNGSLVTSEQKANFCFEQRWPSMMLNEERAIPSFILQQQAKEEESLLVTPLVLPNIMKGISPRPVEESQEPPQELYDPLDITTFDDFDFDLSVDLASGSMFSQPSPAHTSNGR